MTAPTTFEIGTSLAGCVTLASLDLLEPEYDFTEYSASVKLANGLLRGLGKPIVTWHYGFLSAAQYTTLRAYCPLAGSVVWIATPNNAGTYARYTANMVMPIQYTIRSGRRLDVTISFENLTAAE